MWRTYWNIGNHIIFLSENVFRRNFKQKNIRFSTSFERDIAENWLIFKIEAWKLTNFCTRTIFMFPLKLTKNTPIYTLE